MKRYQWEQDQIAHMKVALSSVIVLHKAMLTAAMTGMLTGLKANHRSTLPASGTAQQS